MDDPRVNQDFKGRVCALVSQIPKGKVTTYGRIAAMCGSPRAARVVGGIAHYGDPMLPWHRVVKADGSLAEGYYGGVVGHEAALRAEAVEINNGKVNLGVHLWRHSE